jgi:signal peptidase I
MPKKTKNYDHFLVQGGSMLPTLKPGQKIKILKTKDVKIGDIIIFKSNNLKRKKNKNFRVIHRVVKINGNQIITKGDHRYNCDRPIMYKEILGKLIKVGNKRVDKPYYNFINPFIAKISYYSMKINPMGYQRFRAVYNYLNGLKMKLIGDRNLYITFFLSLPHKINYGIFRLLKK